MVIWCSTASSPPSTSTIADANGASTISRSGTSIRLRAGTSTVVGAGVSGGASVVVVVSGASVVVVELPDVSGTTGGGAKLAGEHGHERLASLVRWGWR